MSATISSLVSGAVGVAASPPPPASSAPAAATRDPLARQPLAPTQISPFPPAPTSATDDSASIHALPSLDPSSLDPTPRVRANSFPTSKREWSAAEARQAAAEASGKSGWKRGWRKIRNLFKVMRGAFRSSSSSKSDAGSVMEKDGRGLLMVPKRKHKATMATEVMPPVPPLPEGNVQPNVDGIGVRSAPNHPIPGHSRSHVAASDDADDDFTPLGLLNSPDLAPPRIPAIPFPPASSTTNDTSPPPSTTLQDTPPQLLITLDDGYVYEAFTIERAHVVFPRRSTDSTVPTVDRRRRVRRRSKTPAADEGDEPAMTISTEAANPPDEDDDEAPSLPSPTPTWASSDSLGRSSALASTLGRMLQRRREAPELAESATAQDEENVGVEDHRGYCTATDTESELASPAASPTVVPEFAPLAEKAHDEGFVAELDGNHSSSLPIDSLPPTTASQSLGRESISSFDLADLAHSTPLPLSPTDLHLISSSPPASSVSLTPSDSGVQDDEHEHDHAQHAHDQVVDSGTHSDDLADAPDAAMVSPPSIQITLDDGFAYDAFTIERAHKVFPRPAAEPGSGVATIDRRRRVRRRSEVGAEHQQKQAPPMSVE